MEFKEQIEARRNERRGVLKALGIFSRSTIQKHIANLKAEGRLRRIGPDKGGHWEVVGTL